jgi:O-antigen ligase
MSTSAVIAGRQPRDGKAEQRGRSLRPRFQRQHATVRDRYFAFLMIVLAGYALFDKGFAYVGYSPVFIGEVTMLFGLLALAWSNRTMAVIGQPISFLLLLLLAWVAARTIPYWGMYGIDALRDSVVVLYSLFALIICGLLLERPARFRILISAYRRFSVVFSVITPPLFAIQSFIIDAVPVWPRSNNVHILSLRPGDIAVHLCGVLLFTLLGFARLPLISIVPLFLGVIIVGSQNRGGTLALLVPLAIAWVFAPRMRQLPRLASIGGATLLICSVLGVSIALPLVTSERLMSTDQLFRNVGSIIYPAHDPALEGTKIWRLQWWDAIVDYTIHGPYFWTGKGFGINLAESDGFGGTDTLNAPLRSPHNSHLTLLARGGVPGIILWSGTCLAWALMMLSRIAESRRRGADIWRRFFIFIFGYWLAIVIDAGFDVALEGPMMGIWFWSLFGVGMAASIVYGYENKAVLRRSAAVQRAAFAAEHQLKAT